MQRVKHTEWTQLLQPWLPQIRKALVGFLVAGGLTLLALVGVDGDMSVNEALTALGNGIVTYILVWLIRNEEK